jgi:hypothetical protein
VTDAYLIVSPKHTMPEHRYVTFWRPESKGYCWPLSWAGRYPRKALAGSCWWPEDAFAVPEAVALTLAVAPRPGDIDGDAGPVVPIAQLPALREAMFVPLTEADRDDMRHALGRPTDPFKQPYRNRYVCGVDTPTARRFEDLGVWDLVRVINDGRDAIYEVTEGGVSLIMQDLRQAYAAQRRKEEAAGIRDWRISIDHHDHVSTVRAKSRAAAKYQVYLQLADAGWCDSYIRYLKTYRPQARAA